MERVTIRVLVYMLGVCVTLVDTYNIETEKKVQIREHIYGQEKLIVHFLCLSGLWKHCIVEMAAHSMLGWLKHAHSVCTLEIPSNSQTLMF